jgi:hypothetical protein
MVELYWFYNRDFDFLCDAIEIGNGKIKLKYPGKSPYNSNPAKNKHAEDTGLPIQVFNSIDDNNNPYESNNVHRIKKI